MVDVSIIIPVYNGEKWIDNCMSSIATQTAFDAGLNIEIVVFNDGSTDRSELILENWANYYKTRNILFNFTSSGNSGVGAAKNGAVKISRGNYLCFQDIDDVMHPDRIILQYEAAKGNHNALIGSRISRVPANSTPRLVRWANNLSPAQLKTQIYTANGPTLLMPTWFCHRSVFKKVGGFTEQGHGTPEDLIFFYSHIDLGGDLHRVDKELVVYTYHEDAATFSVTRKKIWQVQLDRLEKYVISNWKSFMVWNAGKWGRRLLRSLTPENLHKVTAVCDVDKNKIGTMLELYSPVERIVKNRLPIIHFLDAKPPLLICVKLDLTNGQFEKNLNSLNLTEGVDYVLFN
ncbi:UDP-GlcNAc:betaGal beta-1,3-N-acetylglucosaminyltransferase-like protein 1 [Manduca sexta]|uniref:Glycosyltransferase 2-like domain-containing protein n=1 Tax=Manduca sexta TaxID=7130 RepID=A0A922CFE5_MANSE|nr:UDP-GlcNAc:betaGal beta-1,3-N-acetylglucosaminyltransferase-like protein 1 [Manduca sexta]KAG6444950.1 hypothetical protein O3G_MSEX003620 [Manduca sexta]